MGASKYDFAHHRDGFTISAPERRSVRVALLPTGFLVSDSAARRPERLGLFEYYHLSQTVAARLMADWRPHEGSTWNVKRWALTQTAGAIGKRVHAHWRMLLETVDPTVRDVQRAVFAATMGCGEALHDERLYGDRWLVQDIRQYRAAAIAGGHAVGLAQAAAEAQVRRENGFERLAAELEDLKQRATAAGFELSAWLHPPYGPPGEVDLLAALSDWPALFSHSGESYRSLNRTLMNLPGGIPSGLVCNLRYLCLDHPITERLPLLALLLYADPHVRTGRAGGAPPIHANVLHHATVEELQRAIVQVGEHLHMSLSHRRTSDVRRVVSYLADYPEQHRGRLGGLVDKAIRWHRDDAAEAARRESERLGAETPTARPQVLPEIPGVTFLDSVGSVCQEGADMGHCVGTYAEAAVRGHCYLFHVERNGDSATIELAPNGQVVQACGPQNYHNRAATWGRRILHRWASQHDLGEPVLLAPEAVRGEVMDYDDIPF